MSLKEIFCQGEAVGVLQRAFAAGKVPHAYIFAGPEGVGKFTTVRQFAKLLLCGNPSVEDGFADSCGDCQSCRLFEAGSHPDFNNVYKELIQFTKEGKDRKTPVDLPKDVVREFLIDKVATRPTLSERKVFIVSEAERLNRESQNCSLKVLEEPPEYCCIILICTHLERLLPTIKSRCQIIRFSTLPEEKIIEKIRETGLNERPAKYLARLAQGSLGRACQWAELELADANLYRTKKELISSLTDRWLAEALELAEWLLGESKKIADIWAKLEAATSRTDINRRAAKTLLQIIISALHDAMILNITPDKPFVNFDQKERIKELAERFDTEQLAEKIADCYETLRWVDAAVNERLIFERLLLNLAASDRIRA